MIGQTVSHYRITERLGGGGMGVVYRAEDQRLRRVVAIKVLPPDLTRDAMAKERFVIEAQAASALDHPNICTIHEIDETPDGQMFLVMAHYPGETLKQKIDRGPLTLDDALDYAIQIAQALKKAHESGIVHRDIKPANVLLTTDALVKVLDFGLAKLVSQSGLTRTGTVLGTVSYMSPEQASGRTADARSDLWSLGVVIHEMIAGQVPFRGDSDMAVASAIAHAAPPPLTSLRAGLPLELDRVVGRALAKNPEDRYQTAADLLSELRRLRRESDGHSSMSPAPVSAAGAGAATPRAASASRRMWIGVVGLIVVAASLAFWLVSRQGASTVTLAKPTQVVATVAVESLPSWSPDGRLLAYQAGEGPNIDIWITQLGGGLPVNRTADFVGPDTFPRWSPDGLQIAFASTREGGGVFVMPALAGTPRKVGPPFSLGAAPPVWSLPAGDELGYPVEDKGVVYLELLNIRSGTTRRLVLEGRKGNARVDFTWSPDGKFVAYVDARNYTAQITQVWILRVSDGRCVALSDGRTNDWSPSWSPDSRSVFFTSNRGGVMDLWRQPVASDGSSAGTAERLTTGLEVASIALSKDGTRLAYSKGRWLGNAFRVPILPDRPATWADAQQLTFDQAHIEYLDVSRDGQRLAVSSDKSGNPDIWILPAEGGEMRPLVSDPTPDWNPAWSPDGKEIVFYAYRSGNREIWVQPVAGGPARQLTTSDTESVFPRWAPDGKSIVYNRRSGGSTDVWVVPAAGGGPPQEVIGTPASEGYPDWSPVGNWLAFESDRGGSRGLWRMPAVPGAQPLQLTTRQATRPHWSADGKTIYFLRQIPPTLNAWSVAVDTGTERQLTDFTGRRGRLEGNAIASDGRFLYLVWRDDVGDLWVMDVGPPR